jgi:hypothetical protein
MYAVCLHYNYWILKEMTRLSELVCRVGRELSYRLSRTFLSSGWESTHLHIANIPTQEIFAFQTQQIACFPLHFIIIIVLVEIPPVFLCLTVLIALFFKGSILKE